MRNVGYLKSSFHPKSQYRSKLKCLFPVWAKDLNNKSRPIINEMFGKNSVTSGRKSRLANDVPFVENFKQQKVNHVLTPQHCLLLLKVRSLKIERIGKKQFC